MLKAAPAAGLIAALFSQPAAALDVLSPPVLDTAGLEDQVAAFGSATHTKPAVSVIELLKMANTARTAPADVVFATPQILDGLKADLVPGTPVKIGRVNVVLAVRKGGPHPDISTVPKLAAALAGVRTVVYTDPDPAKGSLIAAKIDAVLKRPEFAKVHSVITHLENGAAGLIAREGDMTLQFETEILIHPELEVVAPVPAELGLYVDIWGAVPAKSSDPASAKALLAFLTRPEAAPVWKAHGLAP